MSNKYRLNRYDWFKAIQMFIITSMVVTLGGFILVPGFDLFTADWVSIIKSTVNTAVIATFSYLLKNMFTTSNGQFLGKE